MCYFCFIYGCCFYSAFTCKLMQLVILLQPTCVYLFVCPFLTLRCRVTTAKHIVEILSPLGSFAILQSSQNCTPRYEVISNRKTEMRDHNISSEFLKLASVLESSRLLLCSVQSFCTGPQRDFCSTSSAQDPSPTLHHRITMSVCICCLPRQFAIFIRNLIARHLTKHGYFSGFKV